MKTALWVLLAAAAAGLSIVGLSRFPLERIGSGPPKPRDEAPAASVAQSFTPGVAGRSPDEICQSTSPECRRWTELARKCQDNMTQREAGYMGQQQPYCSEMEAFREQVTGIAESSSPGAYSF
jgi:hypothetical protein